MFDEAQQVHITGAKDYVRNSLRKTEEETVKGAYEFVFQERKGNLRMVVCECVWMSEV